MYYVKEVRGTPERRNGDIVKLYKNIWQVNCIYLPFEKCMSSCKTTYGTIKKIAHTISRIFGRYSFFLIKMYQEVYITVLT